MILHVKTKEAGKKTRSDSSSVRIRSARAVLVLLPHPDLSTPQHPTFSASESVGGIVTKVRKMPASQEAFCTKMNSLPSVQELLGHLLWLLPALGEVLSSEGKCPQHLCPQCLTSHPVHPAAVLQGRLPLSPVWAGTGQELDGS